MTDKIGSDGSPTGIGCTDPDGTCFSVYHSCTVPFRIVGDVENGAVSRSEYECESLESMNEGWPSVWFGDNGEEVDASVPGVYRRESSIWSDVDNTLTTVPTRYIEDAGGVCGSKEEEATGTVSSTESPEQYITTTLSDGNETTPAADDNNEELKGGMEQSSVVSSMANPGYDVSFWTCVLFLGMLIV